MAGALIAQHVGRDRVIVDDRPGTTRDAISTPFTWQNAQFELIDTAGMRRRSRIEKRAVEEHCVLRATQSVRGCDVAWLVLDVTRGIAHQDKTIARFVAFHGKLCILVVNKWDLIEKDDKTAAGYTRDQIRRFPSLSDYPVVFISALTGQRTWRTIDIALQVYDRRRSRITTGELNRFLGILNVESPPPSRKGRISRMYYCVQPRTEPPTVLFFTSRPRDVPEHYRRFLERRLRERFDFEGTPVRVVFRQK